MISNQREDSLKLSRPCALRLSNDCHHTEEKMRSPVRFWHFMSKICIALLYKAFVNIRSLRVSECAQLLKHHYEAKLAHSYATQLLYH